MTKIVKARKKISRKLGVSLWGRANDPFNKRKNKPGPHTDTIRRLSNYGVHLVAKQKLKHYYGMLEKQFKNTFFKAKKKIGNTEDNFVGMLESRLDTLVYRANFAPTVFASKQIVGHKHILVNGKKVNIPSYQAKVGDVISIAEKSKNHPLINETVAQMERDIPSYLEFNAEKKELKLLALPKLDQVPYATIMEINLIVEFYSK